MIAVGRMVRMHHEMYRQAMGRTKLYRADLAAMAGVKVTSLGRAKLPEPDGVDLDAGHARPWWAPRTAQAWLAERPGKGWRKGQGSAA